MHVCYIDEIGRCMFVRWRLIFSKYSTCFVHTIEVKLLESHGWLFLMRLLSIFTLKKTIYRNCLIRRNLTCITIIIIISCVVFLQKVEEEDNVVYAPITTRRSNFNLTRPNCGIYDGFKV